tara:strand:+ start:6366 stop:7178 length:813 start_codon:yes stop_codon:yes gene_type:complete
MKCKSVVLNEFEQLLETYYIGRTVKNYTGHVRRFLDFTNKPPLRVTNDDFLDYNVHIRNYGYSYKNVAINAIKAYFKIYLKKKVKVYAARRPRRVKILPKNIDHDFLIQRINETPNLKAKLIFSLGYGCGLRRDEIINLRLTDIKRPERLLLVSGKGAKERLVPFSQDLEQLLILYWKKYRSIDYVFNGRNNQGNMTLQYSGSSILKLVKKHIGTQYNFHQLRHSYATRLLSSGIDIATLSKLMGHSNIKTTMVYNHVDATYFSSLPLPL